MNPSWMNIHICSMEKTDRALMQSVFLAYKLRYGMIPCAAEEAEQTYQLSYEESDVCSWLSVSGTHWHEQSFSCAADACGTALDFRMGVVLFQVHSDGAALLELTDPFGHKAGSLTTGRNVPERYPDPLFDETQKAAYRAEFTDALASQAAFADAMQKQYGTAAETASALAPLLHLGRDKLLTDAKYGEAAADTVTMHFKAAPAAEKKLTVRAVFRQIYGEALKPLGFAYARTKEPCLIRRAGDDLIHIIGIRDMKNFIVPFAGAATLYRAELGLHHAYRDMEYRLPEAALFCRKTRTAAEEASDPRLGAKFWYAPEYPESLRHSMQASLDAVLRWVLPVLDPVQTPADFAAYHEKIFVPLGFCAYPFPAGDAVIQYLLPDLAERFEQHAARVKANLDASDAGCTGTDQADFVRALNDRSRAELETERRSVSAFLADPEFRQQCLDELARRKQANLETLRSYGVL